MEKYFEFRKLCLEIQMMEFENYLNDPDVKLGLEYLKLTDPAGYYETMQRYEQVKEDYEKIMAIC